MTNSVPIKPVACFQAEFPTTTPHASNVEIPALPGSKSLTNRALLLACLANGNTTLRGVLIADDTEVMLDALQSLGFDLDIDRENLTVTVVGQGGAIPAGNADLSLGNAGTAFRFLTAACCLGQGQYDLDGIARMRQRPIKELAEPLKAIGADIEYLDQPGYPPLRINASGLQGGSICIGKTLSSQYISALLQVGPYCSDGVSLKFQGPVTSRPYVVMTLKLLERFGAQVQVAPDFGQIDVAHGRYQAIDYQVEPDASNASYFLAAAALIPASRCSIQGLGFKSLQGDVWFAEQVLQPMGASVIYEPDRITVLAPPAKEGLIGIDVDLNDMPDMAQTLAVCALFAKGPTTIRNIGNLRVKETDRLSALQTELSKLGAKVTIDADDLQIEPPVDGRVEPASIDTYDDHRMAMSIALAGLRSPGVVINDPDCVNKTFPRFFEYLGMLEQAAPDGANADS